MAIEVTRRWQGKRRNDDTDDEVTKTTAIHEMMMSAVGREGGCKQDGDGYEEENVASRSIPIPSHLLDYP
ncbi:hypothetical protein CPC08DRAFT_705457 [Agrocybe pediades]|nr:hypothetical protein CPC08DRAFT_705457 [Agrocybe pediades]